MSRVPSEVPVPPTPELLAAYADGELSGLALRAVETWLAEQPAQAAEVEKHRQFLELWQSTQPPPPSEDQWARVFAGIEAAVTPEPRIEPAVEPRSSGYAWRWAMGVGSMAAAAAVLFWLFQTPDSIRDAGVPVLTAEADDDIDEVKELLVVAGTNEVEIVRVRSVDHDALPVGEPPVDEPLALATAADIRLQSFKPLFDELDSTVCMDDTSRSPVIVLHLDGD